MRGAQVAQPPGVRPPDGGCRLGEADAISPKVDGALPGATLCTVVTPAHLDLIATNRQLVDTLNPGTAVRWSITYNPDVHTAQGSLGSGTSELPAPLEAGLIGHTSSTVSIHQGQSLEQVFTDVFNDPENCKAPPKERRRLLGKYIASYHHAAGLTLAMRSVRTRYAILMDPDFFVLRPDWINTALQHMRDRDLAVFGAPWSPRWYQKPRGFPSAHLMIIDLEKAPWSTDSLTPDLVGGGRRVASDIWSRFMSADEAVRRSALRALLRRPWRAALEDFRQRRTIGSSRDTGYRLKQAFSEHPDLSVGFVQAVFRPRDGFMPAAVSPLQRHPMLEAFLPDALRYLPRRGELFTGRSFSDLAYPSFREQGWEEFLWRGAPFAVHVRGELQRRSGRSPTNSEVRDGLDAVLARLGKPPLAPIANP